MYCPKCATQATADQKFCRSCGLNLELHAQILAGHWPAGASDQARFRREFLKGAVWILIGAVGFIVAVVGDKVIGDETPVGLILMYLGGIIGLLGLGLMFYSFIRALWARAYGASADRQWRPLATPTTKLPPQGQPESVLSVTEHTTEFLETSDANTPARTPARQTE